MTSAGHTSIFGFKPIIVSLRCQAALRAASIRVVAPGCKMQDTRHEQRNVNEWCEAICPQRTGGKAPMMTREIVIPKMIDPSGLQVRERELPPLGPSDVLIAMEATGVSYAEVAMLRGRYPGQPAFPFVPGYDVVGRVIGVGADVNPALTGKRVATITETGAWADLVIRPQHELVIVPEELDPAEVDTLVVNGVTAYKMLHRAAKVRAEQTIVVLGAGGGVGTMLVQLARLAGVNVIGTCKSAQRAAVEALGARVVDYTRELVLEDVRALAPDGVDAVFDHVGGESLRSSFVMLRPGGILVCYGNIQASKKTTSTWLAFLEFFVLKALWSFRPGGRKMTFFDVWGRGTFGADRMFRPARFWREFHADLGHLLGLLSAGQLQAHVAHRVPLLRAAEAMAEHKAGGFTGKIVLLGTAVGARALSGARSEN
jgi:NADPH:quinone reductase